MDGVRTSVLNSFDAFTEFVQDDYTLDPINTSEDLSAPSRTDIVQAQLKGAGEFDSYMIKTLLADETPSAGVVDFLPSQSSYTIHTAGENRLKRALARLHDDFRAYIDVADNKEFRWTKKYSKNVLVPTPPVRLLWVGVTKCCRPSLNSRPKLN